LASDFEPDCTLQLARFFPEALAMHIPIQVTALRGAGTRMHEASVLEFGGAQHAIFLSSLPLEFDDRIRLQRDSQGSAETDARVVAVQYHEGQKAVAVKFISGPCDWATQP
jgi:hypothetical protein